MDISINPADVWEALGGVIAIALWLGVLIYAMIREGRGNGF